MGKKSAGILPYKKEDTTLKFFLVHPGGPFWTKKDLGSWSIPKGEFENEDDLLAAKREFEEETSININDVSEDVFIPLSPQKLKSGKTVFAFGCEMEINPSDIKSNMVTLGKLSFPEIDRGEWFDTKTAKLKINPGQMPFLTELKEKLKA